MLLFTLSKTVMRACRVVDAPSTMVVQGSMVKIFVWYDNEWGYSMRMADLTHKVAKDYLGA